MFLELGWEGFELRREGCLGHGLAGCSSSLNRKFARLDRTLCNSEDSVMAPRSIGKAASQIPAKLQNEQEDMRTWESGTAWSFKDYCEIASFKCLW